MRRRAFGRDRGLSTRLFLTMFLLGALYVVFFVVMVNVFQFGILPMVILLGALALFQYYTSDKIAWPALPNRTVRRPSPLSTARTSVSSLVGALSSAHRNSVVPSTRDTRSSRSHSRT
jgi:hypothetical protein